MLNQMKLTVVALGIGILMTFGLIATAAENLPDNAETIVTTEQQGRGDRDGRGGRNARNGDRARRGDRAPQLADDFFDF